MKALTKSEFNKEPETHEAPVPEFGKDRCLLFRKLGAMDLIELQNLSPGDTKLENEEAIKLFGEVLSRSIIDEEHNRMCETDEDVKRLLNRDKDMLVRLGTEALEYNGLIVDDDEEPEKNDDTQTSHSG